MEGEQPLQRRYPTPDARQAAQKNAPKSSEELVEVHRSGRKNRMDRITGIALRAIALEPVFVLQMSDAGFG